MPKIIREERLGLIEQQPPGVDIPVRSFGNTGEAATHFGNQLYQMGVDFKEKLDREEARNDALERSTNFKLYATEVENDLKINMPASRIGYAKELHRRLKERYEEDQRESPGMMARELYRSEAGGWMARSLMEGQNYEATEKVKYFKENEIDATRKMMGLLAVNPNPDVALDEMNKVSERLRMGQQNGLYGNDEVIDLDKKLRAEIAKSLFQGYDAMDSKEGAIQALSLLRSADDKSGRVTNFLNPDDKAALIKHFRNQLESKQREDFTLMKYQADDIKAQAMSGVQVDVGQAQALLSQMNNLPFVDKNFNAIVQREKKDLQTTVQVGGALNQLRNTKLSQWDKFDFKPQTGDTKDQIIVKTQFQAAKANLRKAIAEDSGSYVLSLGVLQNEAKQAMALENIESFANKLTAKQQELEIPEGERRLPKALIQRYGELISSVPNAEGRVQILQHLKQSARSQYDKIFQNMIDDKIMPENFSVLMHLNDKEALASAMDNVIRNKDIQADFKSRNPQMDNVVKLAVEQNEKLESIRGGLKSGDPSFANLSMFNALKSQIITESMKSYNQGDDVGSVVDRAVEKLLTKDYRAITAGRSQILIPAKAGNVPIDPGVVGDFIDDVFRNDLADNISAFVGATKQVNYFKDVFNVEPPEGMSDEDYQRNLMSTGTFVTNKNRDGLILLRSSKGSFVPVYNKSGKQVQILFKDIMNGSY